MQADTRSGSGEPELQIGCLSELLNGRIRACAVSNRAYGAVSVRTIERADT